MYVLLHDWNQESPRKHWEKMARCELVWVRILWNIPINIEINPRDHVFHKIHSHLLSPVRLIVSLYLIRIHMILIVVQLHLPRSGFGCPLHPLLAILLYGITEIIALRDDRKQTLHAFYKVARACELIYFIFQFPHHLFVAFLLSFRELLD